MQNWIIWDKTVLTLTLCIAQTTEAIQYTLNECPRYDAMQSDGEVPVMWEL